MIRMISSVMLISAIISACPLAAQEEKKDKPEIGYFLQEKKCLHRTGVEGKNKNILGECGDFQYDPINDLNLSKANLQGITFYYTSHLRLTGVETNFYFADFYSVYFAQVNFTNANFTEAYANGSQFIQSNLTGSKWNKAHLRGIKTRLSDWRNVSFNGADLRGSTFFFCRLQHADFRNADMREMILWGTKLDGSLYNSKTKLPFSETVARKRNMKKVE